MKKIKRFLFLGIIPILALSACDLQPKILALPDSVGEFITVRYPALLADPETQPEIYNAAATDYGVYASPELYGSQASDDYLLYANVNDYVLGPQGEEGSADSSRAASGYVAAATDDYLQVPLYGDPIQVPKELSVRVAAGDTLYSIARSHKMTSQELATLNNLSSPYTLSVGQTLKIAKASARPAPMIAPGKTVPAAPAKVEVQEIAIGAGDTLYSISRRYAIPVNDLAVMNKITPPFTLSVGQTLKVPKLDAVPIPGAVARTANVPIKVEPVVGAARPSVAAPHAVTEVPAVNSAPVQSAPKPKISSDPNKKLPAITARSSSKFSWPIRGSVLSSFGAKSNGLFNDGINISARAGTKVGAAENGVVAYAGNEVKGMGNLVIVQHSGGWMTVYAHMDDMAVRRGARVTVGQKIGTVGKTGKVDDPQLHFEIRKGTKAYNPASYLSK